LVYEPLHSQAIGQCWNMALEADFLTSGAHNMNCVASWIPLQAHADQDGQSSRWTQRLRNPSWQYLENWKPIFANFNNTYSEMTNYHSRPICSNINFIEMCTNTYRVTYYFKFSPAAACIWDSFYLENLSQ
jgi:hypothetical protein